MQSDIQNYLNNGFTYTIVNRSGLGAVVLQSGNLVVKFGLDPAYDAFIQYVFQHPNSQNLPRVHNHALPKGAFPIIGASLAYTRTEMELLDELTPIEAQNYDSWINVTLPLIINGTPISSDPLGLLNETINLVNEAKRIVVNLDLYQSKNVMKRPCSGEYIHIDPFN